MTPPPPKAVLLADCDRCLGAKGHHRPPPHHHLSLSPILTTGACLKPAVVILPLYAYSPWAASHQDTFPTEMHAKDFHENAHGSIIGPKPETTQVHQPRRILAVE